MSKVVRWLLLVVVLVAAVPAALFTVQNSLRETSLSLDLVVWAAKLSEPMPVPHLMWMAFGAGLLSGMILLPLLKVAVSGGGSSELNDDYGSPTV